ncbi:MAG: PP2C family protein-serine/threonine phosphatase [Silvibacterium sp.]
MLIRHRFARRLCFVLGVLLLPAAFAQNFDLDHDRQPVASVDGLWRFHPGDDARWADPAFDDSSWKLLRSDRPWYEQGYPGMSGYAWYRFTVSLPASSQPSSLLLAPFLTGFQLYVDGRLVTTSGPMPHHASNSLRLFATVRAIRTLQLFPLTRSVSAAPRMLHIAIRVWHAPEWAAYEGGGPQTGGSLVGDSTLLENQLRLHQTFRNSRLVDQYTLAILQALIGFTVLGLFLFRRREREYMWFAALLLASALDLFLGLFQSAYSALPIPVFDVLDGGFFSLFIVFNLCFFANVLRARSSWLWRTCAGLALLSCPTTFLYIYGWTSVPVSAVWQVALLLPGTLWIFAMLGYRAFQRDPDALLLLIPFALGEGYYLLNQVIQFMWQLGWARHPGIFLDPIPLLPFSMHVSMLTGFFFVMAMLAFLIRRFALARRREERMASEFEAAREVQQLLLPDSSSPAPDFKVESVYLPAESVGGDFFQQLPGDNNGLLIVVGDVAGKGLPAAMMVSMLVGAIRAEARHTLDPLALLYSLNERMLSGSQRRFATCLVAHLSSGGQVSFANAGHLPPYLNGSPIELPGSLPLGIVSQPGYEAVNIALQPGDRLTFLSDGVVEAQTASGELFGFDRTLALSREPAPVIAEAAQRFGQVDDITVVTVELLGVSRPVTV